MVIGVVLLLMGFLSVEVTPHPLTGKDGHFLGPIWPTPFSLKKLAPIDSEKDLLEEKEDKNEDGNLLGPIWPTPFSLKELAPIDSEKDLLEEKEDENADASLSGPAWPTHFTLNDFAKIDSEKDLPEEKEDENVEDDLSLDQPDPDPRSFSTDEDHTDTVEKPSAECGSSIQIECPKSFRFNDIEFPPIVSCLLLLLKNVCLQYFPELRPLLKLN